MGMHLSEAVKIKGGGSTKITPNKCVSRPLYFTYAVHLILSIAELTSELYYCRSDDYSREMNPFIQSLSQTQNLEVQVQLIRAPGTFLTFPPRRTASWWAGSYKVKFITAQEPPLPSPPGAIHIDTDTDGAL